ncbi:SMARCA3 [Mytilus coruscus]|uniref:SMARCA3 n=1 Tax=Mytilus coruscus TaxID=42192 RepID=A0A6J8A4U8_MYTCO|nr:SMARCA3 [Mytilus coruscus]
MHKDPLDDLEVLGGNASSSECGSGTGRTETTGPRSTLIISPLSVLNNWLDQFEDHIHENVHLDIYTYYGSSRTKDPKIIGQQDIVLTTYSTVTADAKTSIRGETFAYCNNCSTDIPVANGTKGDLSKHVKAKKKKHLELSKLAHTNQKITSSFAFEGDTSVIKSEVTFTKFFILNNLPLSVSDHAGKMFRHMFPDSNIAKKYGCGQTKATEIVHSLSKNDDEQNITPILKNNPFSVGTDGSNDISDKKLYAIVVRYYDSKAGKILTNCLTIPELHVSSGENIFK